MLGFTVHMLLLRYAEFWSQFRPVQAAEMA